MKDCANHTGTRAVADCANCGKPLCADCIEDYEGEDSLCYDCIVERQLSDFKDKGDAERAERVSTEEGGTRRLGSIAFIVVASVLTALVLGAAGFILYAHFTRSSAAAGTPEQEMVWDRDDCLLSMENVREALTAYRGDKGAYPDSLTALEGSYLEETATCPVSGAQYVYRKTAAGYLLECPNPDVHGVASITAGPSDVPHYDDNQPSAYWDH
ncbi:MAG: hypothetical protein C4536_09505 [Actinobacteria bacterium]|nr:MAG: hypothetical protein C4536_09505 [Actinomycetota bacterium]